MSTACRQVMVNSLFFQSTGSRKSRAAPISAAAASGRWPPYHLAGGEALPRNTARKPGITQRQTVTRKATREFFWPRLQGPSLASSWRTYSRLPAITGISGRCRK